ncbi:Vicilin antimicrobial peptides 2-2 [Spatholobus suberectus]|nr:Vicilin antimicrobial peptides 2-2 [Spatholobus suberectus]
MEPRKASPLSCVLILFLTISLCGVKALSEEQHDKPHEGPVVEKDQRKTLHVTEFGEITAIDVKEGPERPPYHLQLFTLEPNSLFLPVLLHADMVFYVHTGSGKLTWANDGGTSTIPLREGDLCSLREGSIFYIQSNLDAERRKLRIYALFTNADDNTYNPSIGAYSRINELVKGFDKKIMQAALKEKRNIVQELAASFLKNFLGVGSNSKKIKTYNIFDHDPDFKNRNGWSIAVTKKQLKSLKRTNVGFLMVNLGMGSILGPHWNSKATEVSVVLEGKGMARVVCGSGNDDDDDMTECHNMRFKVMEGDAFVVPRFHPMAQMSFNDEPFVFLGFTTSAKKNHPQFLAGKGSLLDILDKEILATSFGVSNRTIDQLLRSRDDSIIFGCSSCAEEEEKIMKEEKEKEEEERKRKEEEEKKTKEEEARKKEEEEWKKKEEEARKEEEKEAREKEKERKREEEEAKRQQEERERKREEEEARREREEEREQEEAGREKERKREEEAQREEEEARKQQEKREREREEEEKRKRKRAEEEARREQEREREEEEEAKRELERRRKREEAAAKREQETRERRRQEEEAIRRRQEEAERAQEQAKREQEEAAQREREQARREAAAAAKREQEQAKKEQEMRERRRQEEEEREEEQEGREQKSRKEEEETTARREQEQEQAERQQEKRETRREEEEQREREEEGGAEWEQIEAKRQQDERERRTERGSDDKHTEQSHRSSFEGRRVLKIRNV